MVRIVTCHEFARNEALNESKIIDILNTDSDSHITDDTHKDPTYSKDEKMGKNGYLGGGGIFP